MNGSRVAGSAWQTGAVCCQPVRQRLDVEGPILFQGIAHRIKILRHGQSIPFG